MITQTTARPAHVDCDAQAAGLPGVVTEAQLGNMLKKTERTLWTWRQTRTGPPFIKVGRSVMYRLAAVYAWLEKLEKRERK